MLSCLELMPFPLPGRLSLPSLPVKLKHFLSRPFLSATSYVKPFLIVFFFQFPSVLCLIHFGILPCLFYYQLFISNLKFFEIKSSAFFISVTCTTQSLNNQYSTNACQLELNWELNDYSTFS